MPDKDFIRDKLRAAGFAEAPLFLGFDHPDRSTQCFVARSDELIVVAFRGTEITGLERIQNIVADILRDVEIFPVRTASGGALHAGFNRAADEVWGDLEAFFRGEKDGRSVWFTGHSLGAAVATIAADRYSQAFGSLQGLYTFGSPRVGDEKFQQGFQPPAFRVVNGRDIVTSVPILAPQLGLLPVFYKHLGELRHIDDDGNLRSDDPKGMAEVMAALRAVISTGVVREIIQPLLDHAPIHYSQKLWQRILQ